MLLKALSAFRARLCATIRSLGCQCSDVYSYLEEKHLRLSCSWEFMIVSVTFKARHVPTSNAQMHTARSIFSLSCSWEFIIVSVTFKARHVPTSDHVKCSDAYSYLEEKHLSLSCSRELLVTFKAWHVPTSDLIMLREASVSSFSEEKH